MSPRIGELFAGYGGLGMGVQAALGGEITWYSEIDKGALKILEHRFPDVPNVGDITTVDWSQVEPVDILTGGSPCQDLSHAGKRAGMTEGTRSNLWVAMREAIAQLRPGLVIWENVRGAYSAAADSALEPCPGCVGDGSGVHLRALGRVLGDLSELGYVGGWHGLRAADVGAPHGRFRVFVIAVVPVADARRGESLTLLPTPQASEGRKAVVGQTAGHRRQGGHQVWLTNVVHDFLPTPTARDHKDHTIRREPHRPDDVDTLSRALAGHEVDWGQYAATIARWEALTRPAPPPTEIGPKGNPRLSAAFSEWLMGLPPGWVTDVPGITRNEALKALGNGVVPQQAEAAVRFLMSLEAAA